jgi:site-specific recombinase XerD
MITKKPNKLPLDKLVFDALSQLQVLHYSERSIRRYQSTWNRLIKFAKQQGFKNKLSQRLILEFLEHYEIKSESPAFTYKDWRKHTEFSLKILWNYARFGYFEQVRVIFNKLNIPPKMQKSLYAYKKYCEEKRHFSFYTVNECMRALGLFLDFLGKRNIQTFVQIRPEDLSDFVYSLSRFSQKTISNIISYVRVFFRYLLYQGKLKKDLSQSMPTVCFPRDDKIPSVWDRELLEQLLNAIDRGSPRGKRDYAMLLLACRLGLRMSDICNLTFDQIDWEAETISIIQSKTQQPLILPLTNEVGNALIDYIKLGRPKKNYRQIFLRLTQPFTPLDKNTPSFNIIKYWRDIAGIKFRTKQHHGMHSLRHSLATYLLEDNTPFSVIADILGHTSMQSTMIYAKASVETLRQVALSLKEVDHVNAR